jgi:hypothetical protein
MHRQQYGTAGFRRGSRAAGCRPGTVNRTLDLVPEGSAAQAMA